MHRLVLVPVAVALVLAAAGAASPATQGRWVITDLGTFGGPKSEAHAINDRGQVVGWADTRATDVHGNRIYHAFLWQNGKMRDLGTLGGKTSVAFGINSRGDVVGWSETAKAGHDHAFLWQNGKMRDLGTLGGKTSEAYGINDRGQIVGVSQNGKTWRPPHTGPQPIEHAFLWQNGKMRDLGTLSHEGNSQANAVSDRGAVVGASGIADVESWGHAFLWQNGKMRDLGTLESGEDSNAFAINARGQVVGVSGSEGGHAFLWESGEMRDLGVLAGRESSSYAYGVNDRRQVVGTADSKAQDKAGLPIGHAFVWQDGKMRDLGTLRGRGSTANCINNVGQIVGSAGEVYDSNYDRIASRAVLWTYKP